MNKMLRCDFCDEPIGYEDKDGISDYNPYANIGEWYDPNDRDAGHKTGHFECAQWKGWEMA